jgi:hypothetical protein
MGISGVIFGTWEMLWLLLGVLKGVPIIPRLHWFNLVMLESLSFPLGFLLVRSSREKMYSYSVQVMISRFGCIPFGIPRLHVVHHGRVAQEPTKSEPFPGHGLPARPEFS